LQEFAGQWKGTTKIWFGPDQLVDDDSAVEGTTRSVLDGRFLLHEKDKSFLLASSGDDTPEIC
jgi:Protein of unknown function (DUF1579)